VYRRGSLHGTEDGVSSARSVFWKENRIVMILRHFSGLIPPPFFSA
jgi:hypothetical protein